MKPGVNGGGKEKWFLDHGNCRPMGGQNATGSDITERYHARYLDGIAASWVLAPTHYEEIEWCWIDVGGVPIYQPHHAVPDEEDYGFDWSGFLEAGARVVDEFSTQPGYSVEYYWWGNTDFREQCDNGTPWYNGWVAYIEGPAAGGGGGGCGRAMPCI